MVIEDIMRSIWKDVSVEFQNKYHQYLDMDIDVLFYEASKLIDKLEKGINNDIFQENIVATSGCSHRNCNGIFAGCSMCNWESSQVHMHAVLAALRDKSPFHYAKIIHHSFVNGRGKNVVPAIIEEIATHDIMDPRDFPDEVFDELFYRQPIFAKRPMYGLIAARATNVREDRLLKWKQQFRKNLLVGIGVETGHDFLRNHWINKNSSNKEIENAIKVISQMDCLSTADILLGIPGLSSAHSIDEFIFTCQWLNNTEVDTILVSPLTRKEKTLQNLIYENFQNNVELISRGIVQGEFTSVPSLIMIFETLNRTFEIIPGIENKMKLSPQNGSNYLSFLDKHFYLNQKTRVDEFLYSKFKSLIHYNMTSAGISKNEIKSVIKELKDEKCYQEFLNDIQKQKKHTLKDNLLLLSKAISNLLWEDNWELYYNSFVDEIKNNWDGNDIA